MDGELRPALTIDYIISLPYSKENEKVMVIYCHMLLHIYGNHLNADLIEQKWSGFEPRSSGFKTNYSTIMPSFKGMILRIFFKRQAYSWLTTANGIQSFPPVVYFFAWSDQLRVGLHGNGRLAEVFSNNFLEVLVLIHKINICVFGIIGPSN